jgi:tetratricopeptide (TPR) repeat protein
MDFLTSSKRLAWIIVCTLIPTSLFSQSQDPIINAFQESYSLESYGDYSRAAESLIRVYLSDSYEINLRLGWLFYQAGKMNESITYYNRAITLKPYGIEARFGIALPYSAQGRWDDVLAQYNRILEVDPQNSIANYRLGLIYYNRALYERAEPFLEKVVNLYPFDYDSLLLFAWIKLQLGKTREARVLFNKVLMHTPNDPSATEGLSLIK